MSKAVSYYDWKQSFKNNSELDKQSDKEEINSLGVSDTYFKNFVKKWKDNNLV
ncbi:MAG: hypothetical protein ACXAC5_14485 [Promethearchaeota archaeon]|jgi:hypothetical protein